MGRTKAQPKRKPLTATIVGAAAHAASASLSSDALSALLHRAGEDAWRGEDGRGPPLEPTVPSSTSCLTPSHAPAIVTPTKPDRSDTAVRRRKKRRKINGGDSYNQHDSDDDSATLFDTPTTSVTASRRKLLDDDDTISNEGHGVRAKRRVIFEDDVDVEELQFTITEANGTMLIRVPSSATKNMCLADAHELVRFNLPNTKIDHVGFGGGGDEPNTRGISLAAIETVESMLMHCNQFTSSEKPLNVAPILPAVGDGMLDLVLKGSLDPTSAVVSLRILPVTCAEKIMQHMGSSRSPPIPIPRKLPGSVGSAARFTDPHPSYTLLRALGGIFRGSIFDDVAMSQRSKDQMDFITAKMVYSVVDNVHAREFEGDSAASCPLDIPGLVPTLRPYQEAAVRWMLRREGKSGDANTDDDRIEWELCWYVVIECPNSMATAKTIGTTQSNVIPLPEWRKSKSSPDERHILCNPFAGWIACSYEEAKYMMLGDDDNLQLKGGILAESMGLGKSVELLACILANPRPQPSRISESSVAELSINSVGNASSNIDGTGALNRSQKPNRAATPSTIRNEVCMCGRSAWYLGCLSWVVCRKCGEAMHGLCAGFKSESDIETNTEKDDDHGIRMCSEARCPSCVANSIAQNQSSIIDSRATLIVTPPAILTQWQREISGHTKSPVTEHPLKVIVYPGVKELCAAESSSPNKDFDLVHPHILADADVVLLTFQTLMSELGHSNDNPFAGFGSKQGSSRLRSRKRYKVLPSPLTSIKWWRVCLDEAQRVETPTAASARMAHKLITDKRWCVSGTPIGRGRLNDLFGLLLFLSLKPFDEKRFFSSSFCLSHANALKRLSHLLQNLMWRSTKANQCVRQQMCIPEMEEKKIKLNFSSVERYFYDQLYESTLEAADRAIASTKAKNSSLLNQSLHRLRAACCHPQVGTSGIGGRVRRKLGTSVAERVLSMDQILLKLIEDSKTKCEEAQRIAILHTVGLAGLTKLQAEVADDIEILKKSMRLYQEALDLADKGSSPTKIMGPAVLSGSEGFCSNQETANDGAATLDWQIKSQSDSLGFGEVWGSFSFVGSPRAVCCVSVKACCTLPAELQSVADSWNILRPKECILQVSSAAAGGAFVNVMSFSLSFDGSKAVISGFHAKKSKACRFIVKSYHNGPATLKSLGAVYTGLNVQLYEPEVSPDNLQQLHCLHNAANLGTTLAQNGDMANSNILKSMERKGKAILDNFLGHAHAVHHESKRQLQLTAHECKRCERQLGNMSEDSGRPWYEDALVWFALNGDELDRENLCGTVHQNLVNYYENNGEKSATLELDRHRGGIMLGGGKAVLNRRGKFRSYNTLDGLLCALVMRLQQGEDEVGLRRGMDQSTCVKRVMDLTITPTEGEVFMNSHCRRCRKDWNQKGPVCSHCNLEDDILIFQRLSNDPEISCVLKAIDRFISDQVSKSVGENKQYLCFLHGRASNFFECQGKIREEINAAKRVWRAHFDLLSDVDESNQCKRAMRLQHDDEDVSALGENEAAFIVHPTNIPVELMDHEAKQATALSMLRRLKEQTTYLKNRRLERNAEAKASAGNIQETCSVCLAAFDSERSVLPCGHSFHPACVASLFKRSGGATLRCPLRCPAIVKPQDVFLASEKNKHNGSRTAHNVNGDWGTKVNHLVGDVMDTKQMGDKGVIFSQWDEMLDIVATALESNNIHFIRPRSGKSFGKDIKQFRSSNCPILLMNVKNGAEGLTLTEANHVFMLEPILNCGLDSQAVNRIHRIGQTSKSYIHRYIVSGTVEEKIDEIRMEREEHHFEDDLKEQKKHSIKGGGIDGGLDVQELRELFGRT